MSAETVLTGPPGDPGGGPAPADLEARFHAEAVRRGLITPAQAGAALEEARAAGVPLVDVLVRKNLIAAATARELDEELREDFIPGYRVLSKLGEGGMGVVYRALQKRLDRVVALKVVMPQYAANPTFLRRFEREARAVAKLNHPAIVAAYDFGESNGRLWLAMEFVEGRNAADWVREDGPVPEARALAVVRDVAAGLSHAHAAGILHRDIKPANILIAAPKPGQTGSGSLSGAKITDLGLARTADSAGATELTAAGSILGTPGYMAPEQAFGEEIDQRADIYALGATLYQLLTGQRPFEAATPVAVIARQRTDSLRDPRDFAPAVSPGAVALLQGMLSREPSHRHPGWKEVLADVDAVREGGMPAHPLPPPDLRSIGDPMGPVAGAVMGGEGDVSPAGTVAQEPPASARVSAARTPAPAPASAPAAAPEAKGSRRAIVVVAVLGVLAVAAFALKAAERRRAREEAPPPPAKDGPGAPAPAGGAAAAIADPYPPEMQAAVEKALGAEDDEAAVGIIADAMKALRALPPEGRKLHGDRAVPLDDALRRSGELLETRIRTLAEQGEYGKAEEALRRVEKRMGEATPKMTTALLRLEQARERGADEHRAFTAARKAQQEKDPAGVLRALEDYDGRYGFSWRGAAAARMRAWAEEEMPLVTITTDPPGAALTVDGNPAGLAPQTFRRLPGTMDVAARAEGRRSVMTTFTVEKRSGQVFPVRLMSPDPEPRKGLEPAGAPSALFDGESLAGWEFGGGGQWGVSDPARKVFLAGAEKPEPAALLRGSASGQAWLRRPLAPSLRGAAAWQVEWQMFGERRAGAEPTRVEMRFAAATDGGSLVVGVDGAGAYLGRRAPDGALERTHEGPSFAGGESHTFTLRYDGAVYAADVDGKRLGAVEGPAGADLRAAVEGGTGFFSDLVLQPLRLP